MVEHQYLFKLCQIFSPITVCCFIPSSPYYTKNYAGVIDIGLAAGVVDNSLHELIALVWSKG